MSRDTISLYTINTDVECIKCGNIGAVQYYGIWDEYKKHMSYTIGFGGTIPYRCLNCDNVGLIGITGNLEGYERAFEKIR